MSEQEQIQLARIGQKVDDLKETLELFISDTKTTRADCFAWRMAVDADRNRAKGAIATAACTGGVLGSALTWLGRHL